MNSKNMQISIAILLVGVLIVGFAGCGKEKSETDPNAAAKVETTTTSPVTQTTCPIMVGKPVNKAVSTEYQGKKVYFCCSDCIDKFKAEPAKYTKDLPQFKK